MSDNVPEADHIEVSKEEISLAEAQEQAELNAAQNSHLKRRVVVLRLQHNRMMAQLEQLKTELERLQALLPEDEESDEQSEDDDPEVELNVVANN